MKYCVDCHHCELTTIPPQDENDQPTVFHTCRHVKAKITNIVTGEVEHHSCKYMRVGDGSEPHARAPKRSVVIANRCHITAKLFKARTKTKTKGKS